MESPATQCLIIFVIRTRRSPFASRPHPLLAGLSVGVVLLAALMPLSPAGPLFGFEPLPPAYFAFLAATAITCLGLAEGMKRVRSSAWTMERAIALTQVNRTAPQRL